MSIDDKDIFTFLGSIAISGLLFIGTHIDDFLPEQKPYKQVSIQATEAVVETKRTEFQIMCEGQIKQGPSFKERVLSELRKAVKPIIENFS